MRRWLPFLSFACGFAVVAGGPTSEAAPVDSAPSHSAAPQTDPPTRTHTSTLIVCVGAFGEPEFGGNFVRQAELWKKSSEAAQVRLLQIGLGKPSDTEDRDRLKQALANESAEGDEPLWLVLIGHGTFDGKQARFNLRGPDASATDLAGWLQRFRRPVVIINTTSSSAPFLRELSATNRIVITATRSGHEQNFARFGGCLAEAIADPQSDLDKDGQTSLLESFLSASHRVEEFYKTGSRLTTEHALIDDNGDGLGTPADWFRGVRAMKKPKQGSSLDGARAHQLHLVLSQAEQTMSKPVRNQRDAWELELAELRENKTQLSEADYYRRLEALLLKLAQLYEHDPAKAFFRPKTTRHKD